MSAATTRSVPLVWLLAPLLLLAACADGEVAEAAENPLPADQVAWNEGMARVEDETDLQSSRRIEAAQCAQGRTFTDWVVEVEDVGESGDDGGVDADFTPGQERLTVYYDEPVLPDAPFFDTLIAASEGEQVVISGEFVDVGEGCVVESMNARGYKIRLTDVSPLT